MVRECPVRVRVRKRIHIPETILGSERFGRYQVRGIQDIHKQGIPKMEGRGDGAGEVEKKRQEDVKTEYC